MPLQTPPVKSATVVLVALYFACDGGSGEDGRVILLSKTGADYYLEEPSSPAHRVLAQKSIFVRPHRGFVDPDHIVIVPSDLKWNLLDYLRDCHDISTATVYNDLNGFIRHQGIHRSAYTEFYQGMACQQIEDYRRAIEHYDRALELNPQMAAAFNNRGVAYDSIGKHWRAIEDYDRSLELNPSDAGVYDNRGVAYAHIGIHGQAIQSYSKAIELDHDRAATFANRGESWLHLGEWENAMQDLAKAEGMGCDIARSFHNDYDDITECQDKTGWQMPQNIAEMLSY